MTTRGCRRRPQAGDLGEVSKKDFVAVARILCEERAPDRLKRRLASYFGSQNPRFDEGRFLHATTTCRAGSSRDHA